MLRENQNIQFISLLLLYQFVFEFIEGKICTKTACYLGPIQHQSTKKKNHIQYQICIRYLKEECGVDMDTYDITKYPVTTV